MNPRIAMAADAVIRAAVTFLTVYGILDLGRQVREQRLRADIAEIQAESWREIAGERLQESLRDPDPWPIRAWRWIAVRPLVAVAAASAAGIVAGTLFGLGLTAIVALLVV